MKQWNLLLAAGFISFVGGILAMFSPLEATLAATRLVGLLFIVTGEVQTGVVFGNLDLWTALLGGLAVDIGRWMMGNSILQGGVALTRTIGLLFLLEGGVKIVLAVVMRGTPFFGVLFLTGSVSVLLAGMMLVGLSASSPAVPGILLSIDLIVTGAAVISLALHLKPRRAA